MNFESDEMNAADSRPSGLKPADRTGKDCATRQPIDPQVWEIIVQKNREDDYGFLRSRHSDRCHRTLTNADTGQTERVFWPAEAVLIDILLNSGMKLDFARWLDSGEGDEKVIDHQTMTYVENPHDAATAGRDMSFLKIVDQPGSDGSKVFGQQVRIDGPTVPWVDPDVAEGAFRMLELQKRYNPIETAVKRPLSMNVFPLFRDPESRVHAPISEDRVKEYWRSLMAHCQDAAYQTAGPDSHLITDHGVVFDLDDVMPETSVI